LHHRSGLIDIVWCPAQRGQGVWSESQEPLLRDAPGNVSGVGVETPVLVNNEYAWECYLAFGPGEMGMDLAGVTGKRDVGYLQAGIVL
jgi:hypothetical protein